jgi:hypothetical protein
MKIADDEFTVMKDSSGRGYAVERSGPYVARRVTGRDMERRLVLIYTDKHKKPPSVEALKTVIRLMDSQASLKVEKEFPLRVGRGQDGTIWIDTGRRTGEVIKVIPGKWEMVDAEVARAEMPSPFRRTDATRPLWEPVAPGKGSAARMRKLHRFPPKVWDFLVGWWVLAFVPDIPHCILHLEGSPGTAKTTVTRQFLDLVDPSLGALNGQPEKAEELISKALPSWTFALENVSHITRAVNDALCRLVTGYEDRKRALYTDDDSHIQGSIVRVMAMNGIGITGMKSDLQDRCINIQLPQISDGERRTEEEVEQAFEKAAPSMLGYVLDVLAESMVYAADDIGGKYRQEELPRLAAFGQWLHYTDLARGTGSLDYYTQEWKKGTRSLATEDILTLTISEWLGTPGGSAMGDSEGAVTMPAARWLDNLVPPQSLQLKKDWPATSRGFTKQMRSLRKGLVDAGWVVEEEWSDSLNCNEWKIAKPNSGTKSESPEKAGESP